MTSENWVLEIYLGHSLISQLEFGSVPALRTAVVENRERKFIVRAPDIRDCRGQDNASRFESAGLRYRDRFSALAPVRCVRALPRLAEAGHR
jgi:hypothetical protein